jgi:hypothetical protein
MRKKWINILLFCLMAIYANAQTTGYRFYAALDSVKESGFYNIEITPALSAHLKTDYSDLRIVNDSGKWVPHRLRVPSSERDMVAIEWDIKILKKVNTLQGLELIIQNTDSAINGFRFRVKNTAAKRYCTLTGSDDLQSWYIINDSILLNQTINENKSESYFEINFPSSNYKYFKLLVNNKGKDPINVLNIYNKSSRVAKASGLPGDNPVKNPPVSIIQKDSNSISFLKCIQKEPYHFDKISIKLSGVKYFYRTVDVYLPTSDNNSFANPGQLIKSFIISNNSTLEFNLPVSNATQFFLLIHNGDNLPLKADELVTWNTLHFVSAYLEKENRYKLIMDNSAAVVPDYDLSKLNIHIPDSTAFLSFQTITPFNKPVITIVKKNNNWILWIAIIAALIILLLFTRKMIQEVDKRKINDSI